MDSLITAAARALATGDPLGALQRVALRDDAPALALRGIAMAQLGDLVRAKALLRRAARAFGPKEAVARARCIVAQAEIALVSRELAWPAKALEAARATLEEHGTWEGDESDLRRVDPRTGEVLERLEMPPGVSVSGLESDGGDLFFCGGGRSGKVRTVRRPKRGSATGTGSEIPVDSTRKRPLRRIWSKIQLVIDTPVPAEAVTADALALHGAAFGGSGARELSGTPFCNTKVFPFSDDVARCATSSNSANRPRASGASRNCRPPSPPPVYKRLPAHPLETGHLNLGDWTSANDA